MLVTGIMTIGGCHSARGVPAGSTFGDDVAFLKQHTGLIVLSDEGGRAQVAVVPDYQGRVMTSTAAGDGGTSFGWINRELIASGERREHINVFGGEDRFWLGPEGGQFSIYFKKGDPFDLEHWQVPESIDWGPWETVSTDRSRAAYRKSISLVNYWGTKLDLEANREVRLLSAADAGRHMGVEVPGGVDVVAYESDNRITNTGSQAWEKSSGLLSIWILGMFNPSPGTTVVIPFKTDPGADVSQIVNDAYFGKVPADRLVVHPKQGVLYFKGDGLRRSKIGVSRAYARPILGSYDADNHVLTIVQFTLPDDAVGYVNSMWELQEQPYAGDVSNSYNDGPPEPGAKPLGPFYELESSSPAAALKPGETLQHIHRTIHLQGPPAKLDGVARAVLGVSLDEIVHAFD